MPLDGHVSELCPIMNWWPFPPINHARHGDYIYNAETAGTDTLGNSTPSRLGSSAQQIDDLPRRCLVYLRHVIDSLSQFTIGRTSASSSFFETVRLRRQAVAYVAEFEMVAPHLLLTSFAVIIHLCAPPTALLPTTTTTRKRWAWHLASLGGNWLLWPSRGCSN